VSVFKLMRVVFLLSILFGIVASTWITEKRMAAWDRPILVTVHPIVADQSPATLKYARNVDSNTFDAVNRFFGEQSRPYGFAVTPAFRFQVAPVEAGLPPPVPGQFDFAAIAWWSLKMRWWALRREMSDGLIRPDVQMFLLLHGTGSSDEMGISVGMRKGRYGIVKAYATESARSTNLVVFTHELMHVLGATDKYTISTGEPLFPHGFADPDQEPLFPQRRAEIMGGRIPFSAFSSMMPGSLEQCKIGRLTAEEIGFLDKLKLL